MATLPRLPTKADFPSSLTLDIVPPSSGSPVNILILLHGLGDTNKSFTSLAKNLNLPETACLSVQAPNPIPSLFTGSDAPSFHWGDDVLFDESRGELDLDAGFQTSTNLLREHVLAILLSKCHYPARNLLFLGFGQGGMAALALAAATTTPDSEMMGGIISVGGSLPAAFFSAAAAAKNRTPVLVCGGSRSSRVTRQAVHALKKSFGEVEYVKWEKADDGMPRNRDEMLPLMRFFARRLRSRAGVPEGAVEV